MSKEGAPVIRYEVSRGRATITIDDPERRNPMSTETMLGLADATRRALADYPRGRPTPY